MTSKEAIDYLLDPIGKRDQHDEAIKMAVDALQNYTTQMSGTLVSCSEIPNSSRIALTEEEAALICDRYCRYPREITDEDEMMRECEQCPLGATNDEL